MAISLSARGAPAGSKNTVDYQRDIKPILSDVCYKCHGPDPASRKAKLRLDTEAGAMAELSGHRAIVPGNPARSSLYARITTSNPDDKMPPPDSGRQLTTKQIQLLKTWIEQGARWGAHWSFIPPNRPALPVVKNARWPRNAIDHFILARLDQEKLKPSPETDRAALIRRVTFDLTGLPPTLKEVQDFLADTSPNAYEKVVDRLLASSRYGERMAAEWLDAARYADTNGYQVDDDRQMWLWRDWVIKAFNRNLPFDQFTIEQLAGDLLPNATFDQKVATGFNRNHRINGETGIIPEEYRVEYVVDRVDTTSTIWLGLTMGCARCHDHKYDPLTQQDFYRFFAFFNNVSENGLDGRRGNSTPFIRPTTPELEPKIAEADKQLTAASRALKKAEAEAAPRQAEWEKLMLTHGISWTPLKPESLKSANGATLTLKDDQSILSTGEQPEKDVYTFTARVDAPEIRAFRLELLPDASLPCNGPGRHNNGNPVVTELVIEAASADKPDEFRAVPLQAGTADFNQKGWEPAGLFDGKPETGWALFPDLGKPHAAVVQAITPLKGKAGWIVRCRLEQNFGAGALVGRFRLSVTDDDYASEMSSEIIAALKQPADKRNDTQKEKLTGHFRKIMNELRTAQTRIDEVRKMREQLLGGLPSVMVMEELPARRDTFMLVRGQYDKPGDKVTAGVPPSLKIGESQPTDRLALARWLVDPAHPLTARVAVNRYWQSYFGTGLVKTVEDFGAQGELPSHPQLLDWLATEFIRTGWDIKALQRLIVTSATYRQASKMTPKLLEFDPENRLLARGPRVRLPAEMIRDQALAISGLLTEKIGGPSVKPYQPAGLWEEVSSNPTNRAYVVAQGGDLYRRSLYTFWRRTVPPPAMSTFDAPTRETCTVHRSRTSTPLQALALMNDTTYVEAARVLAERMLTEGGNTPEERVQFAFRLATARTPKPEELAVLLNGFTRRLKEFQYNRLAAAELVGVGSSHPKAKLDPAELAACTTVASLILNLDETITKQ